MDVLFINCIMGAATFGWGSLGWPVLGRSLEFLADPGFLEKEYQKHGPISKINLFQENTVVLTGIENIKKVCISTTAALVDTSLKQMEAYLMLMRPIEIKQWQFSQVTYADPPLAVQSGARTGRMLMGTDGILIKDGEEHTRMRSVVMKTMSPSAVTTYIPYITEAAKLCLETMAEAEGTIKLQDHIRAFTLDVVVDCIVGINPPNTPREEIRKILQVWWAGFSALGFNLPFTKFSRSLRARSQLIELIQMTMRSIRDGADGKQKAAQLLIEGKDEMGNGLSDREIEDNILTLIVAGHDTSATAAMTVLYELQRNKQVLKKAIEEQKKVVANFGEELTRESLGSMEYLHAVLRETMRVSPVVWVAARRCIRTFEIDGYRIPEGWQIMLSLGATGRLLDDRWPGETEFDPTRFLAEGRSLPGSQMPFGVGPHVCVGQGIAIVEVKVFLALLLRGYEYDIKSCKRPVLGRESDGMPTIVTRKSA